LGHNTQTGKNVPNKHKMYQMVKKYLNISMKYYRWPKNISTFSNLRRSKIYPNWDFWFEKKPSGNPDLELQVPEASSANFPNLLIAEN
jgi:hypothetical protein